MRGSRIPSFREVVPCGDLDPPQKPEKQMLPCFQCLLVCDSSGSKIFCSNWKISSVTEETRQLWDAIGVFARSRYRGAFANERCRYKVDYFFPSTGKWSRKLPAYLLFVGHRNQQPYHRLTLYEIVYHRRVLLYRP